MTNVQNLIKGHNSKVLNTSNKQEQRDCNCRTKDQCPLNGDCLATNIIYKAKITNDNTIQTYYVQCEGEFKLRYNNHTTSFRNVKYRNETKLSKLIWKLKDKNKDYSIKWSIAARAKRMLLGDIWCNRLPSTLNSDKSALQKADRGVASILNSNLSNSAKITA